MLPHKLEKDVVVDPTIPLDKFHYGAVPEKLHSAIGKIKEMKYQHGELKTMTYGVLFPGEKRYLWFLEKELV